MCFWNKKFLPKNAKIWDLRSREEYEICRSRQALSNEYLIAKIGLDTGENETSKVWCCPPQFPALLKNRLATDRIIRILLHSVIRIPAKFCLKIQLSKFRLVWRKIWMSKDAEWSACSDTDHVEGRSRADDEEFSESFSRGSDPAISHINGSQSFFNRISPARPAGFEDPSQE